MWYIVNSSDGKRYPITVEGLTIGREECSILTSASDYRASRQHAKVRLQGDYVEVEDLNSTNGTYINEQRLRIATPWHQGQVLRCGQATFQLIGESVAMRNAPTMMSTANATMVAPAYAERPVAPQPMPKPYISPSVPSSPPLLPQFQSQAPPPSSPPNYSAPSYSAPAGNQNKYPQGTFQPQSTTNNSSAIGGIVTGVILLIIGIVGCQHFQPQMDLINSMLGQFAVAFGGSAASNQVAQVKLLYYGSIVMACIGGILILVSTIRLATARK
ncbi:MAG: FHA domain-containing protein [bacterium]